MDPTNLDDELLEGFPVADALDAAILMHRDAHFGGKFDVMLDYYEKGGRGAVQDFDLERIRELAILEKQMQQNLAAIMLSGADAEKVAESKEAYRKLRSLYEGQPSAARQYPRLIADLILAEEEAELDNAVQAIVKEKGAIASALIELLRSETFHDPLFPGYGLSPLLAAQCLGKIGDKRAIISLFESIGESDFISDDILLDALYLIGEPAKTFLLKVLHGQPITFDNERAAMALIRFKDDPEVAKISFQTLKELDLKKQVVLATDLALICEGLSDATAQKEFIKMAQDSKTPSMLRQDMQAVARHFPS